MSNVFRSNVLANTIAKIFSALLGFILIPITVRVLGVESYGLIGFLTTLQALFGFFDFGMGAAFTRELARLSAEENSQGAQRTLFRSLDVIYWGLAAGTAAAIALLAPFIATRWLNAQHLPARTVSNALVMMGLMVAAQFPLSLYQGGLFGLQRQVVSNVIFTITNTVQKAGAVAVILILSPRVEYFLAWQIAITLIGVIVTRIALQRALPAFHGVVRFSVASIRSVWRYAIGWAGNTIGTTLAGQADKIVLSRVLTLETLGYYTLAQAIASFIWMLISPISTAIFPRFVHLMAKGNETELAAEYHTGNELIACLVLPVASVIAFFSFDVMRLWTRSTSLATHTYVPVIFFATGMALAGLQNIAFHMLLAAGKFRRTLTITLICGVGGIPFLVLAALRYGVVGAAAVAGTQLAALLMTIPIMHASLLRGELAHTLRFDFGLPLLVTITVGLVTYFLRPIGAGYVATIAYLFACWMIMFAGCLVVAPRARALLALPHFDGAATRDGAAAP